jgi:hypothetical protein
MRVNIWVLKGLSLKRLLLKVPEFFGSELHLSLGREIKVEQSVLCFVRNKSNLDLKEDVNSITQAILKFSFWALYYDGLSQD